MMTIVVMSRKSDSRQQPSGTPELQHPTDWQHRAAGEEELDEGALRIGRAEVSQGS